MAGAPTPPPQQAPEPTNPFERQYEDWKGRTPLLCRFLAQGLLVAYVVSWFLVGMDRHLAVIPRKLGKWQAWRLVTSPLAGNSLLTALVAAIILGDGVGPRLERATGTASFGTTLLAAQLFVNVGFVVVCVGLRQLEAQSAGAWPVTLYAITVECLSGPDAPRRLFFVDVPKNYYPLAIFAFMTLLGGGPRLDLALGLAAGYGDFYGYVPIKANNYVVARLEHKLAGAGLTTSPNFVTTRDALGAQAWLQVSQTADWQHQQQQQQRHGGLAPRQQQQQQQQSFSSFMDAIRQRVSGGGGPSDDPEAPAMSSSPDTQRHFPPSGGHVLGTAPSATTTTRASVVAEATPVDVHVDVDLDAPPPAIARPVPPPQTIPSPSSSRTAAANRATILAAVEKRASTTTTGGGA
eukprot:CAMPEP_0118901274 /NCGR_PEP_ID=MMETSP1166-20130328/7047_1 /TAXON_ID=1104430 /ORGANISM="Chrysoreinhardia sp, Strain CCMP3193" /LENGTH=405 /DNA_ID=CAMNT_0006840445 /DNA_START=54 /DNA_END=1271 /DNA_ORIENTATION=+